MGHIPREISKTCWMFLERDGSVIKCTVTGTAKDRSFGRWNRNPLYLRTRRTKSIVFEMNGANHLKF